MVRRDGRRGCNDRLSCGFALPSCGSSDLWTRHAAWPVVRRSPGTGPRSCTANEGGSQLAHQPHAMRSATAAQPPANEPIERTRRRGRRWSTGRGGGHGCVRNYVAVGRPDRGQLTHACRRSRPFFRPWRFPRRWPGLWCTQAAQAIAHCLVFWPERLDQPPAEFGHFEEVSADRCGVQPRLYANHGNSTREDAVHAPPRPSWGTEAHRRRRPHRLPERRLSRQVRRDRCRPVRSCRPCARRGLRPPRRRGREHWPRHASDRRCQPFEDRRRSRRLAGLCRPRVLRRRRRARMPWLRRRPRLP